MVWNSRISTIERCCPAASLAISAAMSLCTGATFAQDFDDSIPSLDMTGTEAIDPKETISGNAVVGISFYREDDRFNPDNVYVYFTAPVGETLGTQLTTVDGRYVASFEPTKTPGPVEHWRKLNLTVKDGGSVNQRFLAGYDSSDEVAMLVSDEDGHAYPVRWGSACPLDSIRIRINAEGADAYFVQYDVATKKQKLAKCTPASSGSSFKYDHNCDVRLVDISKMKEFQIIRKRGATYEKPIPVAINVPTTLQDIQSSAKCEAF